MNSFKKRALSIVGLVAAMISLTGVAATQHAGPVGVAPFTDNLQIHITNFPEGGAGVIYQSNNNVYISGPAAIASGDSSPYIHVHSDEWTSGDPQMTLTFLPSGRTCTFEFHDGALAQGLTFTYGGPPSCKHLIISPISKNDQYDYSMSISYQ